LLLLLVLGLTTPTLAHEEEADQKSSQPAAKKEGKKTTEKSITKTFTATFFLGEDGKLVKVLDGKPAEPLEGLPEDLLLKLKPLIEEVSPEVRKGAKIKTSGKMIIIDENGNKTVKPFEFESANRGGNYKVHLPDGVALPEGVKKHISSIFLSPVELAAESDIPLGSAVKVITVGPDGKQTCIDLPNESVEFKKVMGKLPKSVRRQVEFVVKPQWREVETTLKTTNSLEKKLDAILKRLSELEKKVSELE